MLSSHWPARGGHIGETGVQRGNDLGSNTRALPKKDLIKMAVSYELATIRPIPYIRPARGPGSRVLRQAQDERVRRPRKVRAPRNKGGG